MSALRFLPALLAPSLALIGWSAVAPLGAFVAEPARPALLALLLVGRLAMSDAYRFRIQTTREARAQVLLPLTALTCTAAALLGLPALDARPELLPAAWRADTLARWAGVLLFGVGIGLQAWSARTLGRWFSPRIAIQPAHQLIRSGPYARLRHPFYSGLLLTIPGLPLAFGWWLGLPLLALVLPVVLWRVSVEEGLLQAAFGEEFTAHAARTRRLVPWLF